MKEKYIRPGFRYIRDENGNLTGIRASGYKPGNENTYSYFNIVNFPHMKGILDSNWTKRGDSFETPENSHLMPALTVTAKVPIINADVFKFFIDRKQFDD
jgi:hypothetical protein